MAFSPFAALTGSAYDQSADQQRSYLADLGTQIQGQIEAATDKGIGALQTGTSGAVGAIAPAIQQGRTDISGSVDPAIRALYGGQTLGSSALTGAVDPAIQALTGGVGAATGAYDPLKSAAAQYGQFGGQANQAQADALGLNGPEGTARAQANFNAGPGFQYAYGRAIDAATRGANATGMGASGNTLDALAQLGTNFGNQAWQQYVTNLKAQQDLFNPLQSSALGTAGAGTAAAALTGGTGAANIYTGTGGKLSDLFQQTGQAAAPVYTGAGSSLANLATTGGLNTANYLNQGGVNQANLIQALTGQQVGAEQNLGKLYNDTFGAQAAATTGASQNLLNLGGQAATFAAGGGFLPSFGPGGLQFGQAYGSMAPKTNTIFNLTS